MLEFEWDERKATANLAKHGVAFVDACAVFHDPFALDVEERSMDHGEVRRRIIGLGGGRFLTVIYTERGDAIRLISARKSTQSERREYENAGW
ncbi:BrnT family toxin [Rhizobium sp. TRM96647]|uniref:BrnT family toxin n=1 Tax=unclassified Rhizobium TaxID=2613769 RepID=UPI0021E84820|nr:MULTISPECIES: BrnT family toxin [unclassified Rhizobium]MCV3737858.1 BrnT family toxin [Rhizobium sp. TRM96647]MCV3759412.1 BrnT family toxin [Rhizobium sp. TRM96650]